MIKFKTTQVENGIEWLTTFKEQWNNRSRDLECDSVDSLTRQILQTKKIQDTIHFVRLTLLIVLVAQTLIVPAAKI